MDDEKNNFEKLVNPSAFVIGALPIIAAILFSGTLTESEKYAYTIGISCIFSVLAFVFITGILSQRKKRYKEESDFRKKVATQLDTATTRQEELNADLQETVRNSLSSIRESKKGEFVMRGAIGMQQKSIEIETDVAGNSRFALHSHLPSYMRSTDLTKTRGDLLYATWEPKGKAAEYYEKVNKRQECLLTMLQQGVDVYDVFPIDSINKYIEDKHTEHDEVKDPPEEVKERLLFLSDLIDKHENYLVYLIPTNRKGPNFLLVEDSKLLIDIRVRETKGNYNFEKSIDGVYTEDESVLKEFHDKWLSIINSSHDEIVKDREKVKTQIREWITLVDKIENEKNK